MGEVIQVLHSRSHSFVRWWGQCPGAERLSKHGVEGRSFENRIGRLLYSCFPAVCFLPPYRYLMLLFVLSFRLSAPGVKVG